MRVAERSAVRTSRSGPARGTSVGCVNEDAALTGVTGAVARLSDVGEAERLTEHLAGAPGVRAVAMHTDPGDDRWALVRATGDAAVIIDACRSAADAAVAEIRSRRLRRHRVQWSTGDPTPGVSMVFDVARNAALSADDFHRHWRDIHGPKALAHHIGMWDYDQLSLVAGGEIDLDGIAVVSFPNRDDATQRFFDTDEGAEIIRADAAFFTDSATLGRRLTTEWIAKDDPDSLGVDGTQDWAEHRSLELSAPPDAVWSAITDSVDGAVLHHRPDERMLQVAVGAGLPDAVADYTCRYEVRPTGDGCRFDWSPRAAVITGAESVFDGIVDSSWARVAERLTARFGA